MRIALAVSITLWFACSGCGWPAKDPSSGSALSAGGVTVESVTPLTPREVPVDEVVVDNYNPIATFEPFGGLVFNPKARADKLADEIRITPAEPGQWAVLIDGLDMLADNVTALRVTLSPGEQGRARPGCLYWLRSKDMPFQDVLTPEFLATGGFPFVVRQSVRFEPDGEDMWTARTGGDARWTGTVNKLCISLAFPADQSGQAQAGLRKIEFLAERYASSEE